MPITSCNDINTNETQILHRIRLKKFVPNAPLEDKYSEEKLQTDEEIVRQQDDLYTISWKADFEYSCLRREKTFGQTRPRVSRTTPQAAERTVTSRKMDTAA